MSVIRQTNILGQARFDVPHLRGLESSIAYDFDLLGGRIIGGEGAFVVKGFEVLIATAIGAPATALQISVANSILLHYQASESGSIFSVPADRAVEVLNASNARLSGSFTASTVNYIGIDLIRSADDTTSDQVQFLNPDTNLETPKNVPLARTLDYRIVVSSQDFGGNPNIAPIANVTTDAANAVTVIVDARNMFGRLGTGGSVPDTLASYSWPGGRTEPSTNYTFTGGDKRIDSLKSWMDAVMTRAWELGGGEHWYSATADRNVKFARGTVPAYSTGEWFYWTLGTQKLMWKGLEFVFDNSTALYNPIVASGSPGVTLLDGQCVYVDVDRSTNAAPLTPAVADLVTLGAGSIPGARHVIAWRRGDVVFSLESSFPVGTTFPLATDASNGIVRLTPGSGSPNPPLVPCQDANGSIINTATAAGGYGLRGVGLTTGTGVQGKGGSTAGGIGVYGEGGNGGGYGVMGTGILAYAGGKFVSSTIGPGVKVALTDEGNESPVFQSNTFDGATGTVLDRFGFKFGRISELIENWVGGVDALTEGATPVAISSYFQANMSGGNNPGDETIEHVQDFGLAALKIKIVAGNAAGAKASIRTLFPLVTFNDDTVCVLEFEACLTTTGDNRKDIRIGFHNNGTVSRDGAFNNAEAGVFFYKREGDTNWQAACGTTNAFGGFNAVFDTGVLPVANVVNRFRIELIGANVAPVAGTKLARFYVDGTMKKQFTATFPAAPLYVYANMIQNTAGGPDPVEYLTISGIDSRWRRVDMTGST